MFLSLVIFGAICRGMVCYPTDAEWNGRIFPSPDSIERMGDDGKNQVSMHDHHGRIMMGVMNELCDIGEDPNGFDGDLSDKSSTCFEADHKKKFRPDSTVNIVRKILKDCMYQYIITAWKDMDLSRKRPIVLVSWGTILEMSKVDEDTVIDYIRKYSSKGPEKLSNDGQYDKLLIQSASTELRDEKICSRLKGV